MATLTVSTSLTSKLVAITYFNDGDLQLDVQFVDASGVAKKFKRLLIKGDGSGVYDEVGAQISATSPATLLTNLQTVATNVDTAVSNAIASGKITF